jgi:hypothetical protein
MSNPPYTLWSIWIELPLMHRLFFLILAVVSIYSLFSATAILVRLRSIMNQRQSEHVSGLQHSMSALHMRSANARQLIGATFYLFGFVFFLGLRFALRTPESHTPVGILVLENFFLYFAFAANAFFIFLILHSIQWFVFSRFQACALSLNARHIT